ncbi:MAG: LCP family protein [Atopobiaceae bacterium]|nr:LCP family protein [Atopobiaceae bacterium]
MSARHFKREETSQVVEGTPLPDDTPMPDGVLAIDTAAQAPLPNPQAHSISSPRRSRVLPIVLGALLSIVFIALCAGAIWYAKVDRSLKPGEDGAALTATLTTQQEAAEQGDLQGTYVLLVGSDAREGDTVSRGDVLMLARIDSAGHKVTLVSIPRDTMVNIAGAVGIQKINAAYAFGGASSAVYEVSRFCGVPISHYVEIDFNGLKKVVDLLGGVQVNIPETVSLSQGGTIEAGQQTLTGEQALAYARERYGASGGDFSRAQAQRLIVQAIISQVMQANPAELPVLIGSLAQCVKTDYSMSDAIALSFQLRKGENTVYSAVCPSYTLWQDGVSYDGTMFNEWRDMMKRVDAGLDPNDTTVPIPEPQASDPKLGEAANSAAPIDYYPLISQGMTTENVTAGEAEAAAEGATEGTAEDAA